MPKVKKLYRSSSDKMIAGVCGGIAEYSDIDPVWIRLGFILLLFANGIGFLIYIISWLIIPQDPSKKNTNTQAENIVNKIVKGDNNKIFGAIIIAIGIFLLLKNIFSWFSFRYVWPFGLIAIGFALISKKSISRKIL